MLPTWPAELSFLEFSVCTGQVVEIVKLSIVKIPVNLNLVPPGFKHFLSSMFSLALCHIKELRFILSENKRKQIVSYILTLKLIDKMANHNC